MIETGGDPKLGAATITAAGDVDVAEAAIDVALDVLPGGLWKTGLEIALPAIIDVTAEGVEVAGIGEKELDAVIIDAST